MKKILIIEDEIFLLNLLEKKLKDLGYDILKARDGFEGLDKIKKERPNLVLLDLVLPKKNGLDILREVKKDSNLSNIPIIVISNSGELTEIEKIKKLGAKDWLIKANFDPDELIKKVQKYV